ncbi:MAG TPA: hypothetical protein VGD12_07915, partial [Blastococcus sp.]
MGSVRGGIVAAARAPDPLEQPQEDASSAGPEAFVSVDVRPAGTAVGPTGERLARSPRAAGRAGVPPPGGVSAAFDALGGGGTPAGGWAL